MYTDSDLESAINKGIFSRDAVERFRHSYEEQHSSSIADEENFRLVGGFNDIFVVIISLVVIGSIAALFSSFGGATVGACAVALTSWLLSEYYIRIRRMALPSIVLLLIFSGSFAFSLSVFYAVVVQGVSTNIDLRNFTSFYPLPLFALIGTLLHWFRFQVPVTIALISASFAGLSLALLTLWVPEIKAYMLYLLAAAGGLIFLFAMAWDMSDTRRVTRRSDVAFWLHLLAAPMIMHPLFQAMGIMSGEASISMALGVVGAFAFITLCSLLIDRRAFMVSSLAYVLYAMHTLFEDVGSVNERLGITGLIVGGSMLLLTAYWEGARTKLVGFAPAVLSQRLPAVGRK